jgi:hypothetical protein
LYDVEGVRSTLDDAVVMVMPVIVTAAPFCAGALATSVWYSCV